MEQFLNYYYRDNARNLHNMVDGILQKFGGISDKDYQDFYSLANEVFVDIIKRYDKRQSFEGFLYSCLLNRFKSEMTARNRIKRTTDRVSVSIDMPVGDEDDLTIGDTIQSDFDIYNEVFGKEEHYSEKTLLYLNKLSKLQKSVLNCILLGYTVNEIINKLHITQKQYSDCYAAIHSYRNTAVLLSK